MSRLRYPDPSSLSDREKERLAQGVVRILSHLDQTGGPTACWPFVDGNVSERGYIHWKAPYGERLSDARFAHRHLWELTHLRRAPADLVVRHTCDNPPCCNPAHLLLGTQRQNVADCIERGRRVYAIGSRCARAKLTELQVIEIKQRIRSGESLQKIADAYGVTHGNVCLIRKGRIWKHVTEDGVAVPPGYVTNPLEGAVA